MTSQELAEIRARSADEENWIFLSDDMCQIGLDRRTLLRYVDALTAERDELMALLRQAIDYEPPAPFEATWIDDVYALLARIDAKEKP